MNGFRRTLHGKRVWLTPYGPRHVPRYHAWMCDPELLSLTCSEPLTLEEEVANQREWEESTTQATFLIGVPLKTAATLPSGATYMRLDGEVCDESDPTAVVLVGDCNVVMLLENEDGDDGRDTVELNVCVAERAFRRSGIAQESMEILMCHVAATFGVRRFIAKILADNVPSRKLFVDKLHFTLLRAVPCFHEEHYELRLNDEMLAAMAHQVAFCDDATVQSTVMQ